MNFWMGYILTLVILLILYKESAMHCTSLSFIDLLHKCTKSIDKIKKIKCTTKFSHLKVMQIHALPIATRFKVTLK